jgi:hypothetical protein
MITTLFKKLVQVFTKKNYSDIKFSVDLNHNLDGVSGWISLDKGYYDSINIYAVLTRHGKQLSKKKCVLQRDDVKNANLHITGQCGFLFSNVDVPLIEGNLYKVSFINRSVCIGSRELFFGSKEKIAKLFNQLEILPRSDFKILEYSHTDLLQQSNNDIEFIKKIIIRLRRGKRAHCWRLNFKGEPYKNQIDDWNFIRCLVIAHHELITKNIHPRNIWSLIDTFADYGEEGESVAALSISNILFQERFSQTLNCIYDVNIKAEVIKKQIPYWCGLSNSLTSDDSYDIFITRNLEALKPYPIIKYFFVYFTLLMISQKNSILGENISHSDHFLDMSRFYKNTLSSYKLEEKLTSQMKIKSEKYFNSLVSP